MDIEQLKKAKMIISNEIMANIPDFSSGNEGVFEKPQISQTYRLLCQAQNYLTLCIKSIEKQEKPK